MYSKLAPQYKLNSVKEHKSIHSINHVTNSALWACSCSWMEPCLSYFCLHSYLPGMHVHQGLWTSSWANLRFNNPSDDTLEQNIMAIFAELEAKYNRFEFRKTYSFCTSTHPYLSMWRWLPILEEPNYQTQLSSAWDNLPVQMISHTGTTNHPP